MSVGAPPPSPIRPTGFFVIRTPLLPFDELSAWSEGLEAPGALGDPARLEAALAADRDRLRARLRAIVARPEVRESIFVASPSLDERIADWIAAPGSEAGLKVERVLVRYFARMAARATPFGLFAGGGIGKIGEATHLRLEAQAACRRRTRLDMDYLFALAEALGRSPAVRPSLSLRPSSSLYPAAGRLRYAEARLGGEGKKTRTYHLVAIEPTSYLDATLARSAAGALPGALAAGLVEDDPSIALDEAEAFVGELIDAGVLVSDLSPAVTGPEPVHGMIALLRGEGRDEAGPLEAARDALAALDAGGLGADPEHYRAVARALAPLPTKPDLPRLFQVDLVKPTAGASLGSGPLREIERAVALLHSLSTSLPSPLDRFREAFVKRWGDREVPLAEALDEESGLGFAASTAPAAEASPLLETLVFPEESPESAQAAPGEAHLLRLLGGALSEGAPEIALRDDDLAELRSAEPPPLPDAFAVQVAIAAPSEEALGQGQFRVLVQGVFGPSGARMFGRFCHADSALCDAVASHLRDEEAHRPDAIHAEVVHLPEGRIGNVLLRPLLREHEIVYLGRSNAPAERQIGIDDLRVSVVNDRVVLRSARLGREIIPRLTTAHNFVTNQLGVYRFLGTLQSQGVASLGFSWGALRNASFLPRLVVGRIVLSAASWRLSKAELEPLGKLRGAALFQAVAALRSARRLPRHVGVADGDNVLPIDLDNVLSVETFAHLVKDRPDARLVEMFPSPADLCVTGPEGRFVHEIVVPFGRVKSEAPKALAPRFPGAITRAFLPGSEWLYAKLYCGAATADNLLRTLVAPLVAWARQEGAVDRWFFLRYGDPDWHVRLRLHGAPERLTSEVLPALHRAAAPLFAGGQLIRLSLDTYDREVERYGGDEGIELAERLFEADSDAALGMLDLLSGEDGADARWRLALCWMDRLFDDLGLSLEARSEVVRAARAAFGREHRAGVLLTRQLGERYRSERAGLNVLLGHPSPDHPLAPALAVLERRSERLQPIAAELRAASDAGRLGAPLTTLAGSYIHLTANRLLRAAARAQELVIYDLLARCYESRAARAR